MIRALSLPLAPLAAYALNLASDVLDQVSAGIDVVATQLDRWGAALDGDAEFLELVRSRVPADWGTP